MPAKWNMATMLWDRRRRAGERPGGASVHHELARLRAALDEVRFGVVLLDHELRAQFINRAFRRMWRLPDAKADAKPGEKPAPKSDAKPKTSVGPAPVALVDEATFEMLPKGGNLWVKNAAKESALITEMRKGSKLVIKAASLRGHQSIDTYSLGGFAQAMDRLQKECPGK